MPVDIKSLFSGYDRITLVYITAAKSVVALKIMSGVGEGRFRPDGISTGVKTARCFLMQ